MDNENVYKKTSKFKVDGERKEFARRKNGR